MTKVSHVILTLVEHEGQHWICGEGGTIIAKVDANPRPSDFADAVRNVCSAHENERRSAELIATLKADSEKQKRWDDAITKAAAVVCGGLNWLGLNNDAWNRRIDASAKTCYLTVKRGSNLRGQTANGSLRTWDELVAVSYQRSIAWAERDRWDIYSYNLTSNLRKRFRIANP